MTETHVVYVTREVPDPYDSICPWKEVEIEVEVEVTRGHPGDYWTQPEPDEGVVASSSHQLTEKELDAAIELAISQPPPEAEDMRSLNFIDNEKPF